MRFGAAVCSPSVGHQAVHPIERRLAALAAHGFEHVELVEDDITSFARDFFGEVTEEIMVEGARRVKSIADKCGIKPVVLQPFWFYEGLEDREEHQKRIAKLRFWMRLVRELGVQLVQIPTNWMTEGVTSDEDSIVKDLQEMADIGLEQDPPVSFAYEGVAWGTFIDTWEGTWEITKKVDRPNFGLCIDTYHIVARAWGDPTRVGCKRSDGDEALKASLDRMAKELDVNKIFYVQLGDAELLDAPLVDGHPFHSAEQLPRMGWSRNARLFAWEDEHRRCLPLDGILETLYGKLNFKGLLSMEMFSRHLFDSDPMTPDYFAARAQQSWQKTMKKLQQFK